MPSKGRFKVPWEQGRRSNKFREADGRYSKVKFTKLLQRSDIEMAPDIKERIC
jgi:hypothetical protein